MRRKRQEYARQYYLKHKEKFQKRSAEYYSKHKDEYKIKFQDYNRAYYRKNKERINRNRKRDKSYMSNFHLRRKYGMSEHDYIEMFRLQTGCCAICGKEALKYKRKLAVDHNHTTGKIRGLLCVKCNGGLGCFEENPVLFDKAKEYLSKFST
jgi:hypothetical protein